MLHEVENIFSEAGAILTGHFELTSGLHSPVYWEKFRVLNSPHHTERLCRILAHHFEDAGLDVIAGPTLGGIIIAFEVARQMGLRSVYAERAAVGREFRRGASICHGERVLVVDDVLTTGSSVLEVVKAVRKQGGEVIGIGVLVDRSPQGVPHLDGCPVFSCYRVSTPTFAPEQCPLCVQGIPLTKLGSFPAAPTPRPGESPLET